MIRARFAALTGVFASALAAAKPAPAPPPDPREQLAKQLDAETEAVHATLATVADKLHAAELVRLHRLHAAIRVLHAALPDDAGADERMAAARRRAAARYLLERDASERDLLAAETEHLRGAERTVATATATLPTITLPQALELPAKGKVARKFGDYVHDRSKATLSRRGIDIEVDDHAPAVAPADGVVRYAGSIRGLDHGVIIDHGDYLTVIAKLGDLTLPLGTHVARGDRLGRAAHHRVYLEVRVKIGPGGLPVDPEPLLR